MPSPFKDLKWKGTASRFKPTVDAATLLYYAEGFRETAPRAFKAFALCLYFGLRKAEADCLTWKQIDFELGKVRLRQLSIFSQNQSIQAGSAHSELNHLKGESLA